MVSACETTHNGSDPQNADMDLHYEWNFGDSNGAEAFTDHYNGKTVNANSEQQGLEAAYIYRQAGVYTITLTVKGKNENGDIIAASTTTLLNVGQYYVHLGGATGGTYTLTVNDETTDAIAFNAIPHEVVSALRSLPSLDSSNCRTGLLGMIELFGNLAGTSVTFSITSSLTGIVSTPSIIVEQASASAATVDVSDLSGLTAEYFDSTYDGSNGSSNGTESRPYTAFSSLKTFLEAGGSRVAWLKKNSNWDMSSRILFNTDNKEVIRVLCYGTGNDPILHQTTTLSNFFFTLGYGTSGTPRTTMGDFVFSGIDIRGEAVVKSFFSIASSGGTVGYPFASLRDVVLDSCTWSSSVVDPDQSGLFQGNNFNTPIYGTSQGGTTGSITLKSGASSTNDIYNGRRIVAIIDGVAEYATITDYDGTTKVATVSPSFSGTPDSNDRYVIHFHSCGSQHQGFHLWNCNLDALNSKNVAIVQNEMGSWFSFVGGSIRGGVGGLSLDHHVYMHTTGHNLIRGVQFGSATKNQCVNGNAHYLGGPVRYTLFDGCDITGTQNCIDLSNTDNIWIGHPDDGYFHNPIVQFCKIHSGQVSATQQNGILTYNLSEATLRYCEFWDNKQSHLTCSNTAGYLWQPRWYVYYNRFYSGAIYLQGSQSHYFRSNANHSVLDGFGNNEYCLLFYHTSLDVLDEWEADGNIWYSENTTNPFRDEVGFAEVSFATWQAAGNDPNGQSTDPNWSDPDNGVFVNTPVVGVDWPNGFTSLEYSTDGVTWSEYVNDADVAIAGTLHSIVYFRANTAMLTGTQIIAARSNAASVDTSEETINASLTGTASRKNVFVNANGQYFVLSYYE